MPLLIGAIIMVMSFSARAAELYEGFTSVRALGMGNAYSAVVDNDEALFYNPGSLCRVDGLNFRILTADAAISGIDLVDDARTLGTSLEDDEFVETVRRFFGKRAYIGIGANLAFSIPCFAISAMGKVDINASLHNPAYPNLYFKTLVDYGGGVGFAVPIVPKFAAVGIGIRRLTRQGADIPIGVSTLASLSTTEIRDQIANKGTGYAMDTGVTLSLPTLVKPTLTWVWKNAGYTSFTKESGLTAPPRIEPETSIGAGLTVDGILFKFRPAIEFKHMNKMEEQVGKKVHIGAELDLHLISLRAGLNQGYYTAGVGFDMGIIRVEAATWGVEMGEYPGQDESRRYAVQATIELSLDPTFSLDFKRAASRKLKQRR